MEGFMSHMRQSMAVLVLAVAGLVGCAQESRVVEMRIRQRDGHEGRHA